MKRILICILLSVMIVFTVFVPVSYHAAQAPVTVINVVYDDSGSMFFNYNKDKEPLDSWCHAKYAMEVFAALLPENTTMNVYAMSNYDDEYGDPDSPALFTLNSADGAASNVSKVHNMITNAYGTPFDSVRKAYSDLEKCTADQKWLVVLTDGDFDGESVSNVDNYFLGKQKDVNVYFLGLGPDIKGITPKDKEHIYFDKVSEGDKILDKVIQAATRVLNKDRLDVNPSSKRFSFDVPMKELTVFAQGSDVSINGVKDSHGKTYDATQTPVDVRYSEVGFSNLEQHGLDPDEFKFKYDKNLQGSLATFDYELSAGEYSIDVDGAETIEIYYQPLVEVASHLTDAEGNEVTDLNDLEIGEYTIDFSLVNKETGETIPESGLLGDVSYEATIYNGKTDGEVCHPGDKVTIEVGELRIDAVATYLDYHTVMTNRTYTVFKNKEITFESVDDPGFTVTSQGFSDGSPMKVRMLADGEEVSQEQWESLETLPEVKLSDKADFSLGEFSVVKCNEPGVFEIMPSMPEGGFDGTEYKDCDLNLNFKDHYNSELWSGHSTVNMSMKDDRGFFEKHRDTIIRWTIILLGILLLAGYIPGIKNYFPKAMKKRPKIKCVPSAFNEEDRERNGSFNKSLITTLLPYISEKGRVKYFPSGVAGAPLLKLKAAKGKKMILTNSKLFVGKEFITFNGISITEPRHKELTAGTQIVVKTQDWTYTCVLNK